MKKTLEVVNQLVEEGTLETWAIGGAMAAVFYVEPLLTFDLDVFVLLEKEGPPLQPLAPLYDVLKSKGHLEAAECVMIEGVPVQFLPAYNDLILEALREARHTTYEGVSARVLRVEHLIAICIQTGREKDRERVRLLRDVSEIDRAYLESILDRYKLERNWLP
jgi:predicted nucleotidyltransferase